MQIKHPLKSLSRIAAGAIMSLAMVTTALAQTIISDTITPGGTGVVGTKTYDNSTSFDGATFSLDLGPSNTSDRVVVTGTATIVGTNNKVDITTWRSGTFTILSSSALVDGANFPTTVTQKGYDLHATRQTATISTGANSVSLITQTKNLILQWTGTNGNLWNTDRNNINWYTQNPVGTNNPDSFIDGDVVLFSATTPGTITIGDQGVTVGDMHVGGGNYVFEGSGTGSVITGRTNVTTSPYVSPEGKLFLEGGSTTLNVATDFVAGNQVTAGATVVLGHDKALGVYGGGNAGVLTVSGTGTVTLAINKDVTVSNRFVVSATDQTLVIDTGANKLAMTGSSSIAGGGNLTKVGTGTWSLGGTTSSYSFTGTTTVEQGKLVVESGATLGTYLENKAEFEVIGTFSGSLNNHTSGTATLANAGGVTNDGLIILKSGTSTAAFSGTIGSLTGSTGKVRFAPSTAGVGTLNLISLSGTQVFENVSVNMSTKTADQIIISGSAAGNHTVNLVNTTGTLAVDPNAATLVITSSFGNATFTSQKFDIGVDSYSLVRGGTYDAAPDPKKWYVLRTTQSAAAAAIMATAGVMGTEWHYSLDSVNKRMGEFRQIERDPEGKTPNGDIWVRGNAYHLNADADVTGTPFNQDTWLVDAGGDKIFILKDSTLMLGLFVEAGSTSRSFENYGDGDTDTYAAGLYATWLTNNGWFMDVVLKMDRNKNKFTARSPLSTDTVVTSASYNTDVLGISLEFGKRYQYNSFWLEPGVQIAAASLGSVSYQATPNIGDPLDVKVDSSTAIQYRGQVRVGTDYGRWMPYMRLGLVGSTTSGGEVRADFRSLKPDFDGSRFEIGVGTTYAITARSKMYFEYEYNKASSYDRPWAVNFGYRHAW